MDFEEIHKLVDTAERTQEFLIHDSQRYGNYLDSFYHTRDGECKLDEGKAVSKRMLLEEAQKMARTIDYHEEMLESLRDARENIPDTAEYRVIGEKEFTGGYEQRIDNLVESYNEMFDDVMDTCSRAVRDPNVPDPIMIRSMARTQSKEVDMSAFDRLLT
ncbi:hypothetical protein [Candidatus Nanohalococcus occultus]|uniref:hypothetical protein n=1 Tax=Candidatus Nanohalococcus occultus TaxID=2978047 RepID=UPI0039DFB63E